MCEQHSTTVCCGNMRTYMYMLCLYACLNQLKVWDTHRKTSIAPGNERVKKSSLILEFKGHQYGVQCCAITPGEDLVMSADIDSCVMVCGLYYSVTLLHKALPNSM